MMSTPGTSPVLNDSCRCADQLCPPSVLIPGIVQYLPFRDLVKVAAVSRDWRKAVFERTHALIFVAHAETAMRRHQRRYGPRINDLDTNGRDSQSRKWSRKATLCLAKALNMDTRTLFLVRIMHENERKCVQVNGAPCYSTFLTKTIPIAKAQNTLLWLVPKVAKRVVDAFASKLSLSFDWSSESDQADVARFLFCTVTALAIDLEDADFIQTMNQHSEKHGVPLRLRFFFQKKSEYGVYMDPVHNTIHVASMDIRFLTEQIRNASRSLSRFNGMCGYCKTVAEVERYSKELLHVSGVLRDPEMSDSEHAHCLFKLILYSKELEGGLKDALIKPSRSFGTTIVDNKFVVKLMWCASWIGNKNVHRAAGDMDSDDEEEDADVDSDLELDGLEG